MAFWEWLKAIYLHRRRWLAVTLPTIAVPYIANNLLDPPPVLAIAVLWRPPWWLWMIGFLAGSCAAGFFAWLELFRGIQELTGRPNVTLRIDGYAFVLENSNDQVAVDATAEDLRIPIPERIVSEHKNTVREFGIADATVDTEWVVKFGTVQKLAKPDMGMLTFQISGISPLSKNDLAYVLGSMSDSVENREIPLNLEFYNLGKPKRKWYSRYVLEYNIFSKAMSVRHIDITEAKSKDGHFRRPKQLDLHGGLTG